MMKSNKKFKSSNKNNTNPNIRIMVKCSWSGARLIPSPPSSLSTSTTTVAAAAAGGGGGGGNNKSMTHSTKTGYNSKTKLSEIISHLSHSLPPIITTTTNNNNNKNENENLDDPNPNHTQPFIVYMRTSIYKRDWDITTIGHLLSGVNNADSIMLTLNLPKDSITTTTTTTTTTTSGNVGGHVAMTTTTTTAPSTLTQLATEIKNDNATMGIEPMDIDIDINNNHDNNHQLTSTIHNTQLPTLSPQEAIQKILSSNFDSSSIIFFKTILKIITNILSTPKLTPQQFYQYNNNNNLSSTNSIIGKSIKVRILKLHNKYIQKNIVQMNNGLEFLLHVLGFSYQLSMEEQITVTTTTLSSSGFDFDRRTNSLNNHTTTCDIIELKPEDEDTMKLQSIYHDIIHVLVHDLNISKHDLPSLPISIPSSSSSSSSSQKVAASTTTLFNPYQSHSYNVSTATTKEKPSQQSSTTTNTNPNITATERQVEILKQKEKSIQQSIQHQFHTLEQRNIQAFLPSTEQLSIVSLLSSTDGDDDDKHDVSLLATQIKKLQSSTSSSNINNTFQTKAMREMNKLKSKKVYTHVLLKIYFPDGTRLDIQFVPNEKINDVKDVICNCFIDDCCYLDSNHNNNSVGSVGGESGRRRMVKMDYDFELYIAPPKRILKDNSTLEEEGLVPAAKVFISWKKNVGSGRGGREEQPGWYIQRHFFQSMVTFGSGNVSSAAGAYHDSNDVPSSLFPVSKSITTADDEGDDNKKKMLTKKESDENNGKNSLASKEEMMMKKMMGIGGGGKMFSGKGNILGGSGSSRDNKNDNNSSNRKSGDNNGRRRTDRPKWFKR
jgi:hypothetical protein